MKVDALRTDYATVVDLRTAKKVDAAFLNKDENANVGYVALTISEESIRAMQESRKALKQGEATGYEEFQKKIEELHSPKNSPEIDFHFDIGNRLNDIMQRDGKDHYTLAEESSQLLEAYAGIYDDIMKGYKDGTRNVYTEDKGFEKGYRKKTLEEEIKSLNDAYNDYAASFDAQAKEEPNIIKAFETYMQDLKDSGIDTSGLELFNKAKTDYDEWKNNGSIATPVDLGDRLLKGADTFRRNYTVNLSQGGIKQLLGKIHIADKAL